RNNAVEERRKGNTEFADKFYANDLKPLLDAYTQSVENLLSFQKSLIDIHAADLQKRNTLGFQLMLGLGIVALIIGVVFAWRITRSITHPLRQAVQFAETVSNRDLTSTVQVQGSDETSQLLQALKRMNENLMSVVNEVRSGADSIAVAAGQ